MPIITVLKVCEVLVNKWGGVHEEKIRHFYHNYGKKMFSGRSKFIMNSLLILMNMVYYQY